jgi:hypothetical protein
MTNYDLARKLTQLKDSLAALTVQVEQLQADLADLAAEVELLQQG